MSGKKVYKKAIGINRNDRLDQKVYILISDELRLPVLAITCSVPPSISNMTESGENRSYHP